MISTIVFFTDSPFNQRDYERFGIDLLMKNGFSVEVWDFTPFLHPAVYQEISTNNPIENWEKYHLFFAWTDVRSAISKISQSSIVVCMLGYQLKTFGIYRIISKFKVPYCVFTANALPVIPNKNTPVNLYNRFKKATFVQIFTKLFSQIPYKYLGIRSANFNLAGGTLSTKSYRYPVGKRTKTIWAHSLDYDRYLKECQYPIKDHSNIGVFLDQYLPFHHDFIHMGISHPCTPKEYYPHLCDYFVHIEKKYATQIVIAAHPSSDYEGKGKFFGKRLVIKGKTLELIRKSKFVISHYSTSINFAVLFHKPIIFLTTNQLQDSFVGHHIDSMASMFGKEPINIDQIIEIDWKNELSIDEQKYESYKSSYIKIEGSKDVFFWQLFADYIKKHNV
ncbi:MAG: hypothetical protein U9N13_04735 [Euryarchaeota archaeon]|nr:hypothetical protein [Euryarchaeota archaeon]